MQRQVFRGEKLCDFMLFQKSTILKADAMDMLVQHHLFSWDLQVTCHIRDCRCSSIVIRQFTYLLIKRVFPVFLKLCHNFTCFVVKMVNWFKFGFGIVKAVIQAVMQFFGANVPKELTLKVTRSVLSCLNTKGVDCLAAIVACFAVAG